MITETGTSAGRRLRCLFLPAGELVCPSALERRNTLVTTVERRPIPGTAYEASSRGEIFRAGSDKPLKPVNNNGFPYVWVGTKQPVARLVALAFHGEPPFPAAIARALDGNPMNTRPDNIVWGPRVRGRYRKAEQHRHDWEPVTSIVYWCGECGALEFIEGARKGVRFPRSMSKGKKISRP